MHFYYHQDATRNVGSHLQNLEIGIPLEINGQRITRVTKFNFLGIQLSSTLSWKIHTDYICSKIRKNVGILRHLKNLVPQKTLKMIYSTLIHSHLSYGILAWGFSPGHVITLQKQAVRAVTNANSYAHAEPIFKTLEILAVPEISILRGPKFYYDLKHNQVPAYFKAMFQQRVEVHGYNTRGSQNIHVNPARTQGATQCLRFYIPDVIEKLNDSILSKVQTHSPDGFAGYAKKFLLDQYRGSDEPCDNANCNQCRPQPGAAP